LATHFLEGLHLNLKSERKKVFVNIDTFYKLKVFSLEILTTNIVIIVSANPSVIILRFNITLSASKIDTIHLLADYIQKHPIAKSAAKSYAECIRHFVNIDEILHFELLLSNIVHTL
jgi:hypothetical protein